MDVAAVEPQFVALGVVYGARLVLLACVLFYEIAVGAFDKAYILALLDAAGWHAQLGSLFLNICFKLVAQGEDAPAQELLGQAVEHVALVLGKVFRLGKEEAATALHKAYVVAGRVV